MVLLDQAAFSWTMLKIPFSPEDLQSGTLVIGYSYRIFGLCQLTHSLVRSFWNAFFNGVV